MGFSEPSLYRLIEKHEFKPFDSIDDMITALDAMTVAEEREEVYGNFVPPPKNISQTAPWLVSDSESTLKPSPVTLCASTKRLSADVPETKCIICWDAPSSVLILPCKHFSFCGTCAKEITTTCPKCKGKVASKIENIFVG
uniref:RING-type domain-containing protein n=1 Tax=Plectus sambesii TaxID=2011161 RepID=A0A914X0N4_9BILA